ncbi:M23 family metallopeptidase [Henriciella sp.]|uniref:M23 family metallopeptidase n=1 Tax=Henriciella sp. TaxID=1968823 RepID=UPI00263934C3|nr:M23 family metallopeptidase [Henriciella sp.]
MRYLAPVCLLLALLSAGCASSPDRVRPPTAISTTASVKAEQGPFQPDANLYLCPNATITNAFEADSGNRVMNFNPVVLVDGKVVMTPVPVNNACMTSGFGRRFGRTHKGLDLKAPLPATIYSAAPGIIREAEYGSGFGNNVVIDHGQGIFTRYAHLERFAPGIRPGVEIGFGQPLGTMGQSGNATGIHLHFEVLNGNYDNARRSFGLNARNPLSFPAYGMQTAKR